MIRTWQDFDRNYPSGWGMWYASRSCNGHVVIIRGGYHTEAEARAAVE